MSTTSMLHAPQWVDLLVRAGQHAPSADNSQPWCFRWDGRSLILQVDPDRGQSGLGPEHPATLMGMGAAIENIVQAAAALGMAEDAVQVGLSQSTGPIARISPGKDYSLPSAARIPTKLFERHTNRGAFSTKPLDEHIVAKLSTMAEGGFHPVVYEQTEQKRRLTGLVREASEVRFRTEEIHRWLAQSLRFTPEEIARGDGLDVATLLLPPGGSGLLRLSMDWRRMKLLNRIGAFKLFAALEASMLQQCAALIAIVGLAEGPESSVTAGRLMERVWIALNDSGIAVHPYFVLSDQLLRSHGGQVPAEFKGKVHAIRSGVAELLDSSDRLIFMLLRVGFPRVPDPVRSRRLPAEALVKTLEVSQ